MWRWETGQRKPQGRCLEKVCVFLGDDPRPLPATLGEQLKRERERMGLTPTVMAKRLGVVQSSPCRWEAGEREPTAAYLVKVIAVLCLQ